MGSRRAKAKRAFGELDSLPSGRFRARYTGPDGARHSAPITFMARIDAEGWLVDQERMISRGEWVPPRRQTREAPLLLLGEYAAAVVGRRRLRPGDGHSPLNDSVQRVAHNKGKAAINVPGLTVHGLRHTSARLAAQLGATLAELQARIGHSTPNMAMRYQHVAAERDAQLAARMSAYATEQASTPSRSG